MEDLESYTQEIENLAGILLDNNGLARKALAADNIRLALRRGILEIDEPNRIRTASMLAGRSGMVGEVELVVA